MKPAFADTSFFVAYLNPRDEQYARAAEFMDRPGLRVVTTAWVLAELGNYLADGPNRSLFDPFLMRLRDNRHCRIIPAAQTQFERGRLLYADRPDKRWSFIDCISFTVMRQLKLTDALTSDHHFAQAGFRVLLR